MSSSIFKLPLRCTYQQQYPSSALADSNTNEMFCDNFNLTDVLTEINSTLHNNKDVQQENTILYQSIDEQSEVMNLTPLDTQTHKFCIGKPNKSPYMFSMSHKQELGDQVTRDELCLLTPRCNTFDFLMKSEAMFVKCRRTVNSNPRSSTPRQAINILDANDVSSAPLLPISPEFSSDDGKIKYPPPCFTPVRGMELSFVVSLSKRRKTLLREKNTENNKSFEYSIGSASEPEESILNNSGLYSDQCDDECRPFDELDGHPRMPLFPSL